MPSLKEIKNRLTSVNSTRKITSAMKMVASSKLHHAQQDIERLRPYADNVRNMTSRFLGGDAGPAAQYAPRPVHRVAMVLFTSNSSLCGAFNANAVKQLLHNVQTMQQQGVEIARIYTVGKKGAESVRKSGLPIVADHHNLVDHPAYAGSSVIARELMQGFIAGEWDKVVLVYHHFRSAGSQVLTTATLLPIDASEADGQHSAGADAYIVEPDAATVLQTLLPQTITLSLHAALLDNIASEHAARVIAMQVATDNADELLRELTLTYNKTRQQAITTELLDIVGGSMA